MHIYVQLAPFSKGVFSHMFSRFYFEGVLLGARRLAIGRYNWDIVQSASKVYRFLPAFCHGPCGRYQFLRGLADMGGGIYAFFAGSF